GQGQATARTALVAVATAVVPAAGQGVGDPQLEVRRLCLATIVQAAAALDQLTDDPRLLGVDTEARTKGPQGLEEWNQLRPLAEALRDAAAALSRALHDPDVQVRLQAGHVLETMAVSRGQLLQRAAGAGVAPAAPGYPDPAAENGEKETQLVT